MSPCLTDVSLFDGLRPEDVEWLEAMGWKRPHVYWSGCVTADHCGECEPCSCDFGLYQ